MFTILALTKEPEPPSGLERISVEMRFTQRAERVWLLVSAVRCPGYLDLEKEVRYLVGAGDLAPKECSTAVMSGRDGAGMALAMSLEQAGLLAEVETTGIILIGFDHV